MAVQLQNLRLSWDLSTIRQHYEEVDEDETRDEMIEVAGRWQGSLSGLFEQKRDQSNLNPALRKRWVSVTIVTVTPRNRSEGLHS